MATHRPIGPRLLLLGAAIILSLVLAEAALRLARGPADLRMGDSYVVLRTPYFSESLKESLPWYHDLRTRTDSSGVTIVDGDLRARHFNWQPAPGTRRIVCIGDSLTEHWPIPGFRNYTDHLSDALVSRGVEVLPLGVGGYNPTQELAWFLNDFKALDADLLLLQLGPNDVDEAQRASRSLFRRWRWDQWPEGEVRFHNRKRPAGNPPYLLLWFVDHAMGLLLLHDPNRGMALEAPLQLPHALLGFREECMRRGIPLRAVIFPHLADQVTPIEEQAIVRILDSLGIQALDLRKVLPAPLDSLADDPIHPNARGHALAARAIADWIGVP